MSSCYACDKFCGNKHCPYFQDLPTGLKCGIVLKLETPKKELTGAGKVKLAAVIALLNMLNPEEECECCGQTK